jgi:hypothetical protein
MYKLAKCIQNGTELIAEFKSFAAAAKALRAAGPGHFIQGKRDAWWYEEVAK